MESSYYRSVRESSVLYYHKQVLESDRAGDLHTLLKESFWARVLVSRLVRVGTVDDTPEVGPPACMEAVPLHVRHLNRTITPNL